MSGAKYLAEMIERVVDEKIAKALRGGTKTVYGEYVGTDSEGKSWVMLPGADNATPVKTMSVEAKAGDIVSVTIGNGRATVSANVSNPGAGVAGVKSATEKADTAQETADSASNLASQASNAAAIAQTSAENALVSANDAAEYAADAANTANAARASADSASVAAGNAITSADSAKAAADSANESATQAVGYATQAREAASEAIETAEAAKDSADTAKAAADQAVEDAASAKQSAAQANTAANGAVTGLATVQQVVDQLEADVDDLQVHVAMMDAYPDGHGGTVPAGLHIVPTGAGYFLVSSNDGVYVYDSQNNFVTKFGESIDFASTRPQKIGNDSTYVRFYDSDGDGIADRIEVVADSVSIGTTDVSTALSQKADNSTVTAVANRVTKNEQDISGINTTIGSLQTTVESKADGSALTTVSNKLNTVSDTVDGHTQTLTSVTSTQTTIQQTAVKSTVQLWFTKSNTTAPNKPTAHVTVNDASKANQWNLAVPTYNASYPNYYYCYEYQYLDGSYGWSAVTRDIATGESQATARTAASDASTAKSDAATAKTNASNAVSTANTANTNASNAVSTANTANTNASNAVETANTASTNASNAVSTANTAKSTADTAKSTATTAKSTADTAKSTADKNVRTSQQLWFTKANSTAPSAPSSKVTSTETTGNAWTTKVPVYSSSYPYYFYCMQYIAADGTVTWSDVVYDQATTEAQSVARTTSANLSTLQSDYATFKQTTQEFESTVGTTYATKTELGDVVKTGIEYIEGTQTGNTGAWTGKTRDAALAEGKTIAYRLPHNGSGNATLNLTLSGGGTTGAKAVYLNTTRVTTHFGAGAIIQMTYDGTNWRAASIPNTNNYDRRLHNNYVKSAAAVTSGALVCGTSAGYRAIAANVSFDLSYPILWADGAWESGKQYANAYEAYPSVDPTKTGTVQGAAVNKMLWLKGTVTGTTFKVAASNFLTCTIPTSSDNFYYIPLGVIPNDSTAKIYFSTSDKLYAFLDGAFQRVDISATTRIHKAETAIEQTNEQVALKANSSDVYTKTESDGLISTEVSNRNAAITAKANEITQSVSNTYATKTALNGKADSSTVTALTNRVTTAESTITQHTTDISARVTKTEFEALDIGGRNLLFQSQIFGTAEKQKRVVGKYNNNELLVKREDGFNEVQANANFRGIAVYVDSMGLAVGDKLVFSTSVRSDSTVGTSLTFYCMAFNASGTRIQTALLHLKTRATQGDAASANIYANNSFQAGAEERIVVEITWLQAAQDLLDAGGNIRFTIQATSSDWSKGNVAMWAPKLERGNRATDWTPAPEDLESYADAAVTTAKAEIKLTTDAISSDVTKVVDGLSQSSHFVQTADGFSFTVDDAIEDAQSAADTALADSVEYIVGTQTAATNLWTGKTREASLKAGKKIAYKLPYAGNSSAATLNLTLSGGGTTGAKGIKYNINNGANNNVTTHFGAGSVIELIYDGEVWRVSAGWTDTGGINNARYRTQNPNAIKAVAECTVNHIICGTKNGYRNVGASVAFDLGYPLLWCGATIAATKTGTGNYLTYNGVNVASSGAVTGTAVNSMVWIKGTVTGNTFTIASSGWLTCVVPTSEDGFCYMPLGIAYSTTPHVYFSNPKDVYAYKDGAFGPVSIREASAAAKTATSYMFDVTGGGVMVHPKGDDDSGWKISSAIELLKDGVSHIWSGLSDGVALMRIGMQSFGNIVLSGLGYVQIRSGSSVVSHMGVLPGDDADVQLSEDAEVGTAYTLPTDMATLTSVDLAGTALSTSDYSVASGKLTLANTSAVQAVYASLTTTTTETVEVEEPVIDPETGEPVIDPETGEPVTETHTETITTTETAPAPLSASYVRSDGVGAAFGKQAERPELDVAMPARFEHPSNVLATHGTAGADTGFRAYRSDTGVGVRFEVGEGGVNHGVWSDVLNRWLVYANKSDTHIAPHIVDGDATSTSQFRVKRANYATTGSAPSSNVYGGYFGIQNKDGDLISYMESRRTTANLMQTRLVVRRKVSGADKYNVLNLGLDASGNAKIALDGTGAAAAWRSALNAVSKSGDTITGTLILSRSTDLNGTADNRPALIVGGLPTANHIEIDSNEIQAKSGAKATAALYLNDDGGDVYAMGHKVMTVAGDTFTGAVRHEASLYIRDGAINRDTATPSANQVGRSLVFEDVNGERIGFVRVDRETDGYTKLKIYVYSEDTKGNETYNGIQIDVNRSGTRSVSVSETAPWRSAFGLNDLFAIGSVDITASSIGHGGNTTVTGTAPSKSGYTPYAVRGWNFTGTTRQNWVNMWACYIDGTTVTLKLGNLHASDTANVTVRVYILYVKTVVL